MQLPFIYFFFFIFSFPLSFVRVVFSFPTRAIVFGFGGNPLGIEWERSLRAQCLGRAVIRHPYAHSLVSFQKLRAHLSVLCVELFLIFPGSRAAVAFLSYVVDVPISLPQNLFCAVWRVLFWSRCHCATTHSTYLNPK